MIETGTITNIVSSGEKSEKIKRTRHIINETSAVEIIPQIMLFDLDILPENNPAISPEIPAIKNHIYLTFSPGISYLVKITEETIRTIAADKKPATEDTVIKYTGVFFTDNFFLFINAP